MFQTTNQMVIYILKIVMFQLPELRKNHDRVESRVALRHEFGAVETGGLVLGTKYMMCPVNEKSIIIYILW
jgi:hypothetical protein